MLNLGIRLTIDENPKTSILAVASIILNDHFAINRVTVRNGQFGKYVAMPSMLVGEEDGKKIYEPVCYAWNNSFKKEIQNFVLESFEKALESPDGKYTEKISQTLDLPFEVAVEPVNSSPGILAKISLNFDHKFVVEGIRLRQTWRDHKVFISMPQYPVKDGKWIDYCNPITKEFRELLYAGIQAAYEKEIMLSRQEKNPNVVMQTKK